jgi:hypothetical protein
LRFKPGPRKFANPDPCQANLNHPCGIFGPNLFGPMFGIVTSSKRSFHKIT